MEPFVIYLIKSAAGLILFYVMYFTFLKNETYFGMNRLYLLSSVILASLLPLLQMPVHSVTTLANLNILMNTLTVTAETQTNTETSELSLFQIAAILWATVAIFLFVRFIIRILTIRQMIRRNTMKIQNRSKIVFTEDTIAPFSFFRYIFLRKSIRAEIAETIIAHEKAHIKQYHSVDLILLELLHIIQWFNPIVNLYKKSIKETHEFLADREVLDIGTKLLDYQTLILNESLQTTGIQLTNQFNNSQIKRRIIMMTTKKSTMKSRLKFLLLVPVTACLIAFFACNQGKVTNDTDTADTVKTTETDTPPATEDEIFEVVDQAPVFGKGDDDLMKYIQKTIKYPKEAKEKGIQGKVFVTFVVNKDGKVTNSKIERSVNEYLDAEALRVISLMPVWNPGSQNGKNVSVRMTLPIQFALQ